MKRPPSAPRAQAVLIRFPRRQARRRTVARNPELCVILPFVLTGKGVA